MLHKFENNTIYYRFKRACFMLLVIFQRKDEILRCIRRIILYWSAAMLHTQPFLCLNRVTSTLRHSVRLYSIISIIHQYNIYIFFRYKNLCSIICFLCAAILYLWCCVCDTYFYTEKIPNIFLINILTVKSCERHGDLRWREKKWLSGLSKNQKEMILQVVVLININRHLS